MEIKEENGALTVTFPIHVAFQDGCKKIIPGKAPTPPPWKPGRLPRITRLMALAIYLKKLIALRIMKDYADIANLTGLTRARITQIMNLTLLAPEIQEEILFMPRIESGHDRITERNVRKIAGEPDWSQQREKWAEYSVK